MIEHDALPRSDAGRKLVAERIVAQLRRGVTRERVAPLLRKLAEIRGRVDPKIAAQAVERAHDPAPRQEWRARVDRQRRETSIEEGSVEELLAQLRTARGAERAKRRAELERVLGGSAYEYGRLANRVQRCGACAIDLDCYDLSEVERWKTARSLVNAWRAVLRITSRIVARTQHEGARQHAMRAYRTAIRISDTRIQVVHDRRCELERREYAAWEIAYRAAGETWPICPG